MRTKGKWLSAILMVFALGLSFAGTPLAQTKTTVDVRNFEVLSVDGNNLVVRDQNGTNEYTVPEDFRFTVDGRKLSVKELKAGMKGTATVTTKTTITPVTVTEIREAVVVDATNYAMTVRGTEGLKRFSQSQLDERGVQILKEGKIIRIRDVRKGDVITATIVSKDAPVVVTEKEVQATLAPPKAESAPTATAPAVASTAQPAAAPPATTPPPVAVPAKAAQPQAVEGTSPWVWYVLIAVVVVLGWFLFGRKKKQN